MSNIVAIVGRPNVGKSTFFNRLIKKNEAIVDSESGVTRDRHYSISDWNGKFFTLIDTGGYVIGGDDSYEKENKPDCCIDCNYWYRFDNFFNPSLDVVIS